MNQQKRYLAYLLRLWQESGDDPQLWRASLEKPQTGRRIRFASLVELFAFLEYETGSNTLTCRQASDKNNERPTVEE